VGIVVGLLLGAGLFCVWWSWWPPAPHPAGAGAGAGVAAGAGGGLRRLLLRAGLPSVGPWALLGTCAGAGVTAGLVVLAVSRSTVVSTGFAVLAAWGPLAAVRARARRRKAVLRDLWPEVVDNLASAVRAGLSLPEALAQLGERGPAVLQPAFRAFAADHRTTGRFGEALDALKERLADPVGDRLCEALRITREVGGSDLGRLLRNLSAFLRDDARTRAELEARQSWTVSAARLAVVAPWVVLALLSTRPESVRAYNSPTGVAVLLAGAAARLVAYRLMLRIGRLPVEGRVLT
jgi:tight adherence protein B